MRARLRKAAEQYRREEPQTRAPIKRTRAFRANQGGSVAAMRHVGWSRSKFLMARSAQGRSRAVAASCRRRHCSLRSNCNSTSVLSNHKVTGSASRPERRAYFSLLTAPCLQQSSQPCKPSPSRGARTPRPMRRLGWESQRDRCSCPIPLRATLHSIAILQLEHKVCIPLPHPLTNGDHARPLRSLPGDFEIDLARVRRSGKIEVPVRVAIPAPDLAVDL